MHNTQTQENNISIMRPQTTFNPQYNTTLYPSSSSFSPSTSNLHSDYSYFNNYPKLRNNFTKNYYNSPENRKTDNPNSPNTTPSKWQKLKDQIFSPGDEENLTTNIPRQMNIALNYTPNFIQNTISRCTYLPYESSKGKKTLILDLDETLVHSAFKPFYFPADMTLNVKVDGINHLVHVLKRPYVEEFLLKMSKHYEIVVFTASISQYANPLLDQLDIHHVIAYRLFREHCQSDRGLFIKDLRRLGRDLKDMIIVDNNPISYAVNQENGIPISTWHYDKGDTELLKIIPLLEFLAYVDDVRKYIKQIVGANAINFKEAIRIIHENKKDDMNKGRNYINKEMNNNNNISIYKFNMHRKNVSNKEIDNNTQMSNNSYYNDNRDEGRMLNSKENEISNVNNNSDDQFNGAFKSKANRSHSNLMISSPLKYRLYQENDYNVNDYQNEEQLTSTGENFYTSSSKPKLSYTPKLNYRPVTNLSQNDFDRNSTSYTGTYLNRRIRIYDNKQSNLYKQRFSSSSPKINVNVLLNENFSNVPIDNQNNTYIDIQDTSPMKNNLLYYKDIVESNPSINNYIKRENEETQSSSFRPYSSMSSYSNYKNNLIQRQNFDYNKVQSNQLRRDYYNVGNLRNERFDRNNVNNITPISRNQNNINRNDIISPLNQNQLKTISPNKIGEYQWKYRKNNINDMNIHTISQQNSKLNDIDMQNQSMFAPTVIQHNSHTEENEMKENTINSNNNNNMVKYGSINLKPINYSTQTMPLYYQYRRAHNDSNINRGILFTPVRRFSSMNESSEYINSRSVERPREMQYSPNRRMYYRANQNYLQERENNLSFGRFNSPSNGNELMKYNLQSRRPFAFQENREYNNIQRYYSPIKERENFRINYSKK